MFTLRNIKRNIFLDTNIQFINQNEISECLSKTSWVVTDCSSIFIINIPDANDPHIEYIYKKEYYEQIKLTFFIIFSLFFIYLNLLSIKILIKNNTIYFGNKFFELNQTINKIIYYINIS